MADLGEKLKAWAERFWWLRGAVTAMTMAALVPSFLDLSQFAYLRMFHAIIVEWNTIMEVIGSRFSAVLDLPPISPDIMNAVVFFLSVAAPVGYAQYRESIDSISHLKTNKLNYNSAYVVSILVSLIFSLVSTLLYWIIFFRQYDEKLTNRVPEISSEYIAGVLLYLLLFVILIGYIWNASRILKGFGRGIVFVVTFIIAMEAMYFMNVFGGLLNSWACETLDIPKEEC